MREVVAKLEDFNLSLGDSITIELLNIIGKPYLNEDGDAVFEEVLIDENTTTLSFTLLENELINEKTYYRIKTSNNEIYFFTIPFSTENNKHDLKSLCKFGDVSNILKITDDGLILNKNFLEKLNLYFTGENPHFENTEKDFLEIYEYFANEIINTGVSMDLIEKFDNYLGELDE